MKLRLKYLVEDVDRHGNVRLYFRRNGKKIRFYSIPGTSAFNDDYANALAGKPINETKDQVAQPIISSRDPLSLLWLCQKYMQESVEYKSLDPRTRLLRKRALERMCLEPISDEDPSLVANGSFSELAASGIRKLRDRLAATPEMANGRVKALRQVFIWAVANDYAKYNPARDVPYIKAGSTGFYTWSRSDIAKYLERHELGTKGYLALVLLLYFGVRRSDLVKLGKQHLRRPDQVAPHLREIWKGRWIEFKVFKGRKKKLITLTLPVLPAVEIALEHCPLGSMTFIETQFGQPFTSNGFGNWFGRRCKEAGVDGSAHGLRKAGATIAAENGATTRTLMAMYGWLSSKQAELYTREADQKRLAGAGMPLLFLGEDGNRKVPLSKGSFTVGQKEFESDDISTVDKIDGAGGSQARTGLCAGFAFKMQKYREFLCQFALLAEYSLHNRTINQSLNS